jgi:hypothetical protein
MYGHLEDPEGNEKLILIWILGKYDVRLGDG